MMQKIHASQPMLLKEGYVVTISVREGDTWKIGDALLELLSRPKNHILMQQSSPVVFARGLLRVSTCMTGSARSCRG